MAFNLPNISPDTPIHITMNTTATPQNNRELQAIAEISRGGTLWGLDFKTFHEFRQLWVAQMGHEPTMEDVMKVQDSMHRARMQNIAVGSIHASKLKVGQAVHTQVANEFANISAQFPATTRKGRPVNEMFLTWCNLVANTPSSEVPKLWAQVFNNRPFPTTDWLPVDGAVMTHPAAPEWIFTAHAEQGYWDAEGSAAKPEIGYKVVAKGPFKGSFDRQRFGKDILGDYEFHVKDKNPATAMARLALVVREYTEPL